MRRPARGGTTHPGMPRPGYGFGRALRPSPGLVVPKQQWHDPEWWSAIELEPKSRAEAVSDR
jgi:hypothetical protein